MVRKSLFIVASAIMQCNLDVKCFRLLHYAVVGDLT